MMKPIKPNKEDLTEWVSSPTTRWVLYKIEEAILEQNLSLSKKIDATSMERTAMSVARANGIVSGLEAIKTLLKGKD